MNMYNLLFLFLIFQAFYSHAQQLSSKAVKKTIYLEEKWSNGNWKHQLNMQEELLNGYCKFYHQNGQIKKEGDFINGKENGIIKTYFENGIKKSEETFTKGKLNGKSQYFSEDNFLTSEGSFLNNFRHGIWLFYNKETSKTSAQITKIKYVNGHAIRTTISPQ